MVLSSLRYCQFTLWPDAWHGPGIQRYPMKCRPSKFGHLWWGRSRSPSLCEPPGNTKTVKIMSKNLFSLPKFRLSPSQNSIWQTTGVELITQANHIQTATLTTRPHPTRTWSGVMPVKQNMPIWSVMCCQFLVLPSFFSKSCSWVRMEMIRSAIFFTSASLKPDVILELAQKKFQVPPNQIQVKKFWLYVAITIHEYRWEGLSLTVWFDRICDILFCTPSRNKFFYIFG